MMELYIQIRDGQPHEHPILGDNFREAFPHIDVDNLPPEFARFERIENPRNAGTFQIDEARYEWDGGVVKDVWSVREMTEEEKTKTINDAIERIYAMYERLKIMTQENIDATTGDAQQAWSTYMDQLQLWVLPNPLDINFPRFPKPPVILEDGTIFTVNSSGSAPNVIG